MASDRICLPEIENTSLNENKTLNKERIKQVSRTRFGAVLKLNKKKCTHKTNFTVFTNYRD